MELKLSTDDENQSKKNDSTSNNSHDPFKADVNSAFIADQYQSGYQHHTEAIHTSREEYKTFPPFLLIISMVLQIIVFVVAITSMSSGEDLGVLQNAKFLLSLQPLCWIFILIDAICMIVNKAAKPSILIWAIIPIPFFYYFRRYKQNGDSNMIPLVATLLFLVLGSIYGYQMLHTTNSDLGILIKNTQKGNTSFNGQGMNEDQFMEYTLHLSADKFIQNGKTYYFVDVLEANISGLDYSYIPPTEDSPELLCVSGKTTLDGNNKTAKFYFTMDSVHTLKRATIGLKDYTDSSELNSIYSKMLTNTP